MASNLKNRTNKTLGLNFSKTVPAKVFNKLGGRGVTRHAADIERKDEF